MKILFEKSGTFDIVNIFSQHPKYFNEGIRFNTNLLLTVEYIHLIAAPLVPCPNFQAHP